MIIRHLVYASGIFLQIYVHDFLNETKIADYIGWFTVILFKEKNRTRSSKIYFFIWYMVSKTVENYVLKMWNENCDSFCIV